MKLNLDKRDADLIASALADYIDGHWGVQWDVSQDRTDTGWIRPAKLLVDLVDGGARPYDAAHAVYLVPHYREALGFTTTASIVR